MSALADIFAAVRLQLDGTGFEAQATALATRSGQNAGTAMSNNLTAAFQKAGRAVIGGAAGLAAASAISGAEQLNQLAGEYQVQTGANAEETKAFQGTLNDLFKTSHQGYDEIAQTLIGIKTHFNLAGDAAKGLAANSLDFAEVAGGTGTDAVERFNSLIKTGIIGIQDTAATMDMLVAAHQNLGIPINDTIDGMIRLAPAMNAVNMTTKDGIALVGLFTKAGVSADRMAQAFNSALTKIKSPAEFPKLINDIANAKTDFDAAQLAAHYFGSRVGPALSNLLRQGREAVDGYNSSLGDTVGALDRAAYANDHTFGGAALLILHQFQGALADVARSMGTTSDAILMAAALLGPGLTRGLLSGIGTFAGLLAPRILAAMWTAAPVIEAAALAEGTAEGAAESAARARAVAASGPEVAAAIAATGPEVQTAAAAVGTSAGLSMVGMLVAAASGVLLAGKLGDAIRNAVHLPGPNFLESGNDYLARMSAEAQQASADAAAKEALFHARKGATDVGTAVTEGVQYALVAGTPAVSSAGQALADAATSPLNDAGSYTVTQLHGYLATMVADFKSQWSELSGKATDAADAIYGPMNRAAALNANHVEQANQQKILSDGKATAEAKQNAQDRLVTLRGEELQMRIVMAGMGEQTGKQYDEVIAALTQAAKSGNAQIAASAQLALDELNALKAAANSVPAYLQAAMVARANRAGFAEGTMAVPFDQLALVHRGEIIVPAAQSAEIRAGTATLGGGAPLTVNVYPGADTSLQTARGFGQAVLDTIAGGLREQTARYAKATP